MKRIILSVLVVLLAISVFSERIYLSNEKSDAIIAKTNVKSIEGSEINIAIGYCDIEKTDGYDVIKLQNYGNRGLEEGDPGLPVIVKNIAIPDNGVLRVEISDYDEEKLPGTYNILPMQKPLFDIPNYKPEFVKNEEIYNTNAFYPEQRIYVSDPAIMRDVKFVKLYIYPFKYNPITGEVYVLKNIKIKTYIDYSETKGESPKRNTLTEEFLGLYKGMFDNYEALESYKPIERKTDRNYIGNVREAKSSEFEGVEGDYVIVVAGSDLFEKSKEFAAYKSKLGYKVAIIHLANYASSEQIKDTLTYAYNNWSITPVFALFIGDADSTLSTSSNSILRCNWKDFTSLYSYGVKGGYVPNDHYMACISGTDYYADIYVSRFNTSDTIKFNTIMQKTIEYETNPDFSDPDWFTTVTALGGYEVGRIFDTTATKFSKNLLNYGWTDWDSLIQTNTWSPTEAACSDSIDDGQNVIIFRGHGAEGYDGDGDDGRGFEWMGGADGGSTAYSTFFSNEDVGSISNGNEGGFAFAPTCLAGNFAYCSSVRDSNSMADYWTQMSSQAGVGYFGATNVSLSYYNDSMALGISHAITGDVARREFARVSIYGKNYMETYAGSATYFELEMYLMNTLGDPAVVMYTDTPLQFTVTYDPTYYTGGDTVVVTVTDPTKAPVQNALVTVYDTLESPNVHLTAYTNASGQASIPVSLSVPGAGELFIGVTKQDYVSYLGSADIEASSGTQMANIALIPEINSVKINLQSDYFEQYEVYRNGNYIFTITSKGIDNNLKPATVYEYKIVGIKNGTKKEIGTYRVKTLTIQPTIEYANGFINVSDVKSVSVFNVSGRKVFEKISDNYFSTQIDAHTYPAGLYIVKGDNIIKKIYIMK